LARWPIAKPRDWTDRVHAPQTEAELDAVRRAVRRSSPFGSSEWPRTTAQRLGLHGRKWDASQIRSGLRHSTTGIAEMLAWDRTHDWVLHRFFNDLARITIHFSAGRPSLAEIAALRRCLPQFRDIAPAAVKEKIAGSRTLSLEVMPTPGARKLVEALQNEGLQALADDVSYVSYLPHDRTIDCALIIEDDAESAAVAQSMIAAGVPVEDI
jgi:hypothetical protein